MRTIPKQESLPIQEAWSEPSLVHRRPAWQAANLSVGTSSSWPGVLSPAPMIGAMGPAIADAMRFVPVLASNTGWAADQLRTLVLLQPSHGAHGAVRWNDASLQLDYDLMTRCAPSTLPEAAKVSAANDTPSAHAYLAEIATWTGLSTSRLAVLLGVSRRSLYNWLNGSPISSDMQRHLARARELIAQVTEHHDPERTRDWLAANEPSNFDLIRAQNWEALQERLAEVGPPRARRVDDGVLVEPSDVDAFPPAVRTAVLKLFASAPRVAHETGDEPWTPRELTGAIPFDEEDPSD